MLSKTIDYLDAFSRFKNRENVEAVERLLSAYPQFHKFEVAQLGTYSPTHHRASPPYTFSLSGWWSTNTQPCTGSLCCDNAEEAKTLIPSLQDKISDNELDDLLNEISKFMT